MTYISRNKAVLAASLLSLVLGDRLAHAAGPAPVVLGAAGFYVILAESGIADVAASQVTGNVGASPITGAAILLSCKEVTGGMFSVDATGPAPCSKTSAVSLGRAVRAMQAAYTDAAGRTATVNELGAGNIGGLVIAPGVYKWSSSVNIASNVTLKGGAKDTWIFQVAQNVDVASGKSVLLRGGAKPGNIVWQVAGHVTIGTTAQVAGIILSKTAISMTTGASINGRLYAQTAVSLQMNVVKKPMN